MKTVEAKCLHCSQAFQAKVKYLKTGGAKFCSQDCALGSRRAETAAKVASREPNHVCDWCQTHYWKPRPTQGKSGYNFCGNLCKNRALVSGRFQAMRPAHYGVPGVFSVESGYRRLAFASKGQICEMCSRGALEFENLLRHLNLDEETYARVSQRADCMLDVHHVDRDRSNNHITNLQVLCVGCHRLTHMIEQTGCFSLKK